MAISEDTEPLIVTGRLDERSFTLLDGLRRRHFPRPLNKIPAHISLFHKLPGAEIASISATLAECTGGQRSFFAEPTEWRFLGRGVAIVYRAPELTRLHGILSSAWSGWLTPQDRQGFRAHVTIQNKVEPSTAKALLATLREDVDPPTCRVEGLMLWRYLGGPWEHVQTFGFADITARAAYIGGGTSSEEPG